MKLFAVAISVENEYAGQVLDLSWCVARDLAAAEKLVKAHVKRNFSPSGMGKDFGKWENLEVTVEECPAALLDGRGVKRSIEVKVT